MSNIQLAAHYATVAKLSRASVNKHFDAYDDVAWDSPELAIDPRDPRFELTLDDPLGGSAWYRAQPQAVRARIGLDMHACRLKVGVEFENILSRGLLELALSVPNGSPDFRYAYHELIEEGQHSLMFQECVNRTGFDAPSIPAWLQPLVRRIAPFGRSFPELFFVYVLAGEVPIDQVQRADLRRGLHPLVRRISQIHVTEEARHVRFAESYLSAHLPRLSRHKLLQLRLEAPIATAVTANLILKPPSQLLKHHRVPRRVVREIYSGPTYRAFLQKAVGPLYKVHEELGIATRATRPLYQALRIGPTSPARNALPSLGEPPTLPH
jgi:hypothetical protein